MTEQEWLDKYKPIEDEANLTDLWETDSPILKAIKPTHVWTLVETEIGGSILAGFHYVNRLGYYITENPYEDKDIVIEAYRSEDCQ